jgi:hypothetical protein
MKKRPTTSHPSEVTRRAALPPRQLRVRSMRGLASVSADGHAIESLIWNRCCAEHSVRMRRITMRACRCQPFNEPHACGAIVTRAHREALGAVVPDAGDGKTHGDRAQHQHAAHPARQRVGLPLDALVDCAQQRPLFLLEQLQQLLHLAVVRLVLHGHAAQLAVSKQRRERAA